MMTKKQFEKYRNVLRIIFSIVFVVSLGTPFYLSELDSPLFESPNLSVIILVIVLMFFVPAFLIVLYRTTLFERSAMTSQIVKKSLLLGFVLGIGLMFFEQIIEFIMIKILDFYVFGSYDYALIFIVYAYHLLIVFILTLLKE